MEENKNKSVITEGEKKVTEGNTPSYEQLKNWCDQLLMQRNQLAERLNQVTDLLSKLPWLFKVVENKESFSSEFVEACTKEIVFIMTPPVEEPEEEVKK